jgi:lipopolysaccharide/colanic/teichoic acid biosynthesis glycosyltransferase
MDIAFALLAVLFVLPLLICIALAILLQDGRPVFFRHHRIGHAGRVFHCLKFRTVVQDARAKLPLPLPTDFADGDKPGIGLRATRLGRFLRRSRLDELPQLFNVLRGDMSIVGPRPIIAAEIPRYRHHFRHYCALKPGITGIWQITDRNDVDYRARIAMDCLYVKQKSPTLYLWIVVASIPAALRDAGR